MVVLGLASSIWPLAAQADESEALAELKQSAQFSSLEPSGRYLKSGRNTIVANFTIHPLVSEPVEFVGILTFDGAPYVPVTLVLTPGQGAVTTSMRWQVYSVRRQGSIRFRLIGIGNLTKLAREFADVTRDYVIGRRFTR